MQSTHVGKLDLPSLPLKARLVHIFPQLAADSLLSVGQLCDSGCTAKIHPQRSDHRLPRHNRPQRYTLPHHEALAHAEPPTTQSQRSITTERLRQCSQALHHFIQARSRCTRCPRLSRAVHSVHGPSKSLHNWFPELVQQTSVQAPALVPCHRQGHLDQSCQHQQSTKIPTNETNRGP
jgi:hypothetical protein